MKKIFILFVIILVSVCSFGQCPYNIIDSKPNKTEMTSSVSNIRSYILYDKDIKKVIIKNNINISFYSDMEVNVKWNVEKNNTEIININRFNNKKNNISYNYSKRQLNINGSTTNNTYLVNMSGEYWVYVKTNNYYKLIKIISNSLIENVKY